MTDTETPDPKPIPKKWFEREKPAPRDPDPDDAVTIILGNDAVDRDDRAHKLLERQAKATERTAGAVTFIAWIVAVNTVAGVVIAIVLATQS